MYKSSKFSGLPQAHTRHFQMAQNIIDGLVHAKNNVRNELFSEYYKNDVCDLDLDSDDASILDNDIHEARIFPHVHREKVREMLDTSKLNEQFELFVNRVFEILKATLEVAYVLLVRMDAACEKIIVKLNEICVVKTHRNAEFIDTIPREVRQGSKRLENSRKSVTVASTSPNEYTEGVYVYNAVQVTHVAVKKSAESKSNKTQGTFTQVVKILYTQLRFGVTSNIDSI